MEITNTNFDLLFNLVEDFSFILDMDGNILDCNHAALKAFGYKKDEILGANIVLIHPPEYQDKAKEYFKEVLNGKRDSCPLPLISKKGIHIPVETKIQKANNNNQEIILCVSRNLSDLTISQDKFYRVFENNKTMMAISELETGMFVNVNKQFLSAMGYKKSEIIGKTAKSLNLYQDYEQRNYIINQLKTNDSIENFPVTVYKKDGTILYVLFSISKIQIQNKMHLMISASDVTFTQKAKEKLEQNIKQQRLLADISQNFISLDNISNKFSNTIELLGIHTNVSRVYIFEDSPGGAATTCTYEWCNNGVIPQIEFLQLLPYTLLPSWMKIINEKGYIFANDINDLPKDIFDFIAEQGIKSILVFPLYVQDKYYGFIGFDVCSESYNWEIQEIELLRTISGIISNAFERIKYHNQLIESELRLNYALENAEIGLWDWKISTGEMYFSDILYKMLGYDTNDIEPTTQAWEKIVHPDDTTLFKKILIAHLQGKTEKYESNHRLLTKSGEWKWILAKGKVIERDEANNPIRAIGVHFDIDKEKDYENELKALNATKDKLFSIIAHDLRSPIGTIMQISEILSDKENFDEENFKVLIRSQKDLSHNTFLLLENLLNWAKINLEQIKTYPKIINFNEIIIETIADFNFRADQKKISIVFAPNEIYKVYADENMIYLVLRNLISNAVKFTHINGAIIIVLENKKKGVELTIMNNSDGISKRNIAKILSKYEFYSTCGTSNEKGTGLGLKLCQSFIKANNGNLKLTNSQKNGTIISFTLPIK